MTLSLINILKSGPPPPRVVLLPDAMFFSRAIPIAPGSVAAEVTGQVELALETLSPFPPAHLFHGFFWPPGAERALVFAAYRRRFTSEQMANWDGAELVLPSFAALLGGDVKPGTTLIVPSAEGLTALYWDASPVPAKVVFRPLSAETTEPEQAAVRDELLRAAPMNRAIVLAAAPVVEASSNEREYAFHAEAFVSRIPSAVATALDVRDKAALAALRRARGRNLALWRCFLGVLAVLILLAAGELALVGGRLWLAALTTKVNAQRPVVEKIETAQNLTTRINELSTRRLLPLEMISLVTDKRPAGIFFLRASTTGLYGLTVEAYTSTPAAVSVYQAALGALPALEKVEVRDQRTRDNVMSFTLAVTFRPDALKPASANP